VCGGGCGREGHKLPRFPNTDGIPHGEITKGIETLLFHPSPQRG